MNLIRRCGVKAMPMWTDDPVADAEAYARYLDEIEEEEDEDDYDFDWVWEDLATDDYILGRKL